MSDNLQDLIDRLRGQYGVQWRPVVRFESFYLVSDDGRVWSVRQSKLMAQRPDGDGYPRVTLSDGSQRKTIKTHRLVAEAWVHGQAPGLEVRHLDDNPSNPTASNLAWGTRSENAQDTLRSGHHNHASKTHCPQGHEYTPENIYRVHGNQRQCVTCTKKRAESRWTK